MTALFVIISVFATTIQSVFKKKVNAKCSGCEFYVSTMIAFFSLLYFLLTTANKSFSPELLPYCIGMGVCFAMASVTCVLAIGCGSLGLTNLVLAYSKIIPIGWSLIFWGESLGGIQILGLVLLALSFIFTYAKRGSGEKFTLKWVILVILLFVSNGSCLLFIKMQQIRFGGARDGSFMIYSLIIAVALLLVAAIFREGKKAKTALRYGVVWSGASGIFNGIGNYFSFLCLSRIPTSIYYPISSAGDLVLTFIFSVALFREKFTKSQVVGFILGIASMVLININ